jgi:SAM-dependent methyltransferase
MDNTARNESHYDKAYASNSLVKPMIKLYLSYDQLSKTRRNLAALKHDLKSSLPLSVLDFGFGHGAFLYRVPRTHQLSGCELSSEAIRNARRLFAILKREVTLFRQDEIMVPPYNKKYDLICCSHVMEHVENDFQLLSDFHACLRDGGKLLLNVPINEVWKDPNHVREYSRQSMQEKLERSNFAVESIAESDRWTAYILDKEYVSKSVPQVFLRSLRLFLAPLPISMLDRMEKVLPKKYSFQQLIVVASKS